MTDDLQNKQPDSVPVTDKLYRLDEEYEYCWELLDTRYRIVIPAGFIYDGASIPRFVWTLTGLRPDGLHRAGALVHDWIYRHKGKLPASSHQYLDKNGQWRNVIGQWSRKDADRMFARLMREFGVSKFRRRMAYRGVRLFGWMSW
ncbi:MAG: DUF1353 domain-containing protein [Gemmatimonadales bacterium]